MSRAPLLLIAVGIAGAACQRQADGHVVLSGGPPSIAYEQHVNAGHAQPPGAKMENPFKGKDAASEGEKMFSAMNCDGCHGGGALGWVGPSLVDGRWRYGGSDGALYHSIFYGRPRGMPAYGGLLSQDAIWKIVAYIRAQPVPANVPTESWDSGSVRPAPVREETPGR